MPCLANIALMLLITVVLFVLCTVVLPQSINCNSLQLGHNLFHSIGIDLLLLFAKGHLEFHAVTMVPSVDWHIYVRGMCHTSKSYPGSENQY